MATEHDNDIETGTSFMPRFNADGLITAVVVDHESGEPLMLAYMNQTAIERSLETGEAHFYSRSRRELWHKGATSGNVLTIVEMRIDCDQDAIWISASLKGHGAACHTGRKSCFYRRLVKHEGAIALEFTGDTPLFDPEDVYSK